MIQHDTARLGKKSRRGRIGILAAPTNKKLKKKLSRLVDLADCCENGAVIAFSLQGIIKHDGIINGYLYSRTDRTWRCLTSPLPDAVINRITLKTEWQDYFKHTLGANMINNLTFNKWDMYEWLSSSPYFNHFLPLTWLMTEPTDISRFVTLHNQCYIKSVNGSYGKGIFKVSKDEKGYKMETVSSRHMKRTSLYGNEQDIIAHFARYSRKHNMFILQHVIDLYVANRPIDFRLIVVKDGSGQWRDVGLLARKGRKYDIVSHSGLVKNGYSALRNMLTLTRDEAKRLSQKMSEVGLEAAKEMERLGGHEGNLGNLGIDFGIDQERRLFIIEINHRNPRHRMAVDAGETMIYKKANTLLADYATKLALGE
ncbi:YheC/YheD family protein [Salipaludibacillus sp. LMS25]|uniref:YheC/YheD family protein n=1 Tax=Salipaludibacillus sp. LMS25 TaxID=2924031 RepID=UPI0020D106FD|nr:YheC/YheD family protein [Salipaludibacillus sp. LMS25]UTR13564.1 YheC/YheD family protein [Salipaludibacillus sp. LMS25]